MTNVERLSGSSAQPILNYKAMNGAAYDVRAPPPAPLAVQCSGGRSLVPRAVLSLPIYKTVSRSPPPSVPAPSLVLRLRQPLIGKDTAGSMGCPGHWARQSSPYACHEELVNSGGNHFPSFSTLSPTTPSCFAIARLARSLGHLAYLAWRAWCCMPNEQFSEERENERASASAA